MSVFVGIQAIFCRVPQINMFRGKAVAGLGKRRNCQISCMYLDVRGVRKQSLYSLFTHFAPITIVTCNYYLL